ncbi:MAG: diaminopimelate decarboxylase [Planctomycetota bacterium]
MDHFQYRDGQLFCEDVAVDRIARDLGTPLYLYSKATLVHHYRGLADAFAELDPWVCYSIKSCGNLHLCKTLVEQGAGMDVVSGGEVHRARLAGADLSKCVFAGVGKTDAEIAYALEHGVGVFNIESEPEFENVAAIAQRMGRTARAALRVNPDVADSKTHAKTTTGAKATKFGVDLERAPAFFARYGKHPALKLTAVHIHIGSPIYSAEPYVRALDKVLPMIDDLREAGHTIDLLDIGGGFAADYETGASPNYADYAKDIVPKLRRFKKEGGTIVIEPGRTIAANAGVLVGRVQYVKTGGPKKFVILDTGMNHLIRPTLYNAWQFVWPTSVAPNHTPERRGPDQPMPGLETCDVVGPVCETGDYLAQDRALPPVARGDLVAVFSSGAYGMVMASNYNALPRPAEALVEGDDYRLIRRRETYEDLVGPELEVEPQPVTA